MRGLGRWKGEDLKLKGGEGNAGRYGDYFCRSTR